MTRLMTVGSAARALGVSPGYVRILVDTGRLKAQRTVGGIRLVSPEEVRRFRTSQSRKATHRKADLLNASSSTVMHPLAQDR